MAWCHAAGGRSIGEGTFPLLLAPSGGPNALASLWLGALGSMETALGFNHSVGRFAGQMAPAGSTWPTSYNPTDDLHSIVGLDEDNVRRW